MSVSGLVSSMRGPLYWEGLLLDQDAGGDAAGDAEPAGFHYTTTGRWRPGHLALAPFGAGIAAFSRLCCGCVLCFGRLVAYDWWTIVEQVT
jgi:hypothetical protein